MLIRKPADIPSSEITPKADYLNRRTFLAGMAAAGVALGAESVRRIVSPGGAVAAEKLQITKSPLSTTGETLTSFEDITHYNNFYEFGTDKGDPARNAGAMHTRPWTVQVTGMVKQKKKFDIDTLLKLKPMEERVYRFRCVEAWSMVIPWAGYSLSEFIKQCDPLPGAKYVQFLSLADQSRCPRSCSRALSFPIRRDCAWMRRCIRSRCSPSASMARRCRTRMARRCA